MGPRNRKKYRRAKNFMDDAESLKDRARGKLITEYVAYGPGYMPLGLYFFSLYLLTIRTWVPFRVTAASMP